MKIIEGKGKGKEISCNWIIKCVTVPVFLDVFYLKAEEVKSGVIAGIGLKQSKTYKKESRVKIFR